MTKIFISDIRKALAGLLLLAVTGLVSCEKLYEYEGDCAPHYFVSFVYDMNMLYADAFSSKVSSVDLYVFDAETDKFVAHFCEDNLDVLRTKDYLMSVDVAPGKYKFVAWCGLAGNEGRFIVPNADSQAIRTIADLTAVMAREHNEMRAATGAYSNVNLDYNTHGVPCALYHGIIDVTLPDRQGTYIYPVKLTKDTNNIIVSIWHRNGELDPDRYDFQLVYDGESNAALAYTNVPLDDEPVVYQPWSQRGGDLDLGDVVPGLDTGDNSGEANDHQQGKFITAEISTSRLMEDHSPRLVIYDNEADVVRLDVDFIKQINAFRSANYSKMGLQEYLDRQDEYSITIILDSTWMGFQIVINGWHVINSDQDL